ncbi:unnamed protein product, partial [Ectocarpus sp. 8 AP-2014]
MENSAFRSAAPTHSVLDRRSGEFAKNRLLNLAFEDGSPDHLREDNTEEPKSVPADVFKQGYARFAFVLSLIAP